MKNPDAPPGESFLDRFNPFKRRDPPPPALDTPDPIEYGGSLDTSVILQED